MKKLILSAAILLGSLSSFAQTATATKTTTTTTQTVEDKYTEIKVADVPSAVTESLKTAHPKAMIEKAFINEKKEYKLTIKTGDDMDIVYADAAGNWIKK